MSWPGPRNTALDRARAVARAYRDALARVAPDAARHIDDAAVGVGEGWVCGATTGERACTVREAALLLGVTDRRVRQLIASGVLRSAGKDSDGYVLLVADVLNYQRSQRVASRIRASALPSDASG